MTKANASLGRLQGELAEPIESIPAELLILINKNCTPPEELTAADVHVRAMYIVSDEVNSYGGRFPQDEHERLVELMIDSPVLVGHRQDKLPVGRNFHAKLVERDGKNWIKCFFYWLKKAEGSESLKQNIDGGICKECSISFTFRMPECSLCNKDIRLCAHEPFEKYPALSSEPCFFNYRQIDKVLETSLVYRGAIRDTTISKELAYKASDKSELTSAEIKPITSLEELPVASNYLIIPRYKSLPVTIKLSGLDLQLLTNNSQAVLTDQFADNLSENSLELNNLQARLIGYRGKERCSEKSIIAFLQKQPTTVNRLTLLVMPTVPDSKLVNISTASALTVKTIPHRFAKPNTIDLQAKQIMTKVGVELWPLHKDGLGKTGFSYLPPEISLTSPQPVKETATATPKNSYQVLSAGKHRTTIQLNHKSLPAQVEIKEFSNEQMTNGRRFLADQHSGQPSVNHNSCQESCQGEVAKIRKEGESWLIQLAGQLAGVYCLRPIRLNGHDRQLFYRLRARTI